ncbi:Chromate transport protein [Corynebacterium kalinowskii]|uniref:Chromate transport protein n=1 Tax=Corynebacterium kalinowskii TaxID=2675216 RepID=A0A6B8VQ64_9CORY|nr:chromate efflux transporter [Corynebacterium kalinowskii]QGU01961.1 Chromate transport protein [Corynebacterium kalinowskii]
MTKVQGSPWEVLKVFSTLGLTSFGGPTAHLGYFKTAFVDKRNWLTEADYANTVALCQFLPGPASSQVGMVIGFRRAGYLGMLMAWLAFTLPSAAVLTAFALLVKDSTLVDPEAGWLKGLLAAAVAVVFHAVAGMAKNLANTRVTATIAVIAGLIVLSVPSPWTHVAVIAVAALAGAFVCQASAPTETDDSRSVPQAVALSALALFVAALIALPILARTTKDHTLEMINAYFSSGALVFGGGHVVMPLLEQHTVAPGWVSQTEFLAGYSAAQAVPGPLFTFASFLGGADAGLLGAAIATIAIFAPSALLVLFGLHYWDRLSHSLTIRKAFAGANAAVVGLLAAALYNPVFTHGISGIPSMAIAAVCWLGMAKWNVPAWAIALGAGIAGWVLL